MAPSAKALFGVESLGPGLCLEFLANLGFFGYKATIINCWIPAFAGMTTKIEIKSKDIMEISELRSSVESLEARILQVRDWL
jgi:hypothetical protein